MNRVPKLRFKEFTEEWEEKKLGECINYKKGYAFKANDYTEKGIRIVRVSDLGEHSIKKENGIYISNEKYSSYQEWEIYSNDIIVTTVGSRPPLYSSMVGKIILVPEKFEKSFLNQNNVLLRSKEKFCQKFIYNYFFRKKYINHIENIARGNANQANITLQDFFEYKISISNLQEQQKIADFLSSVDKKISIVEEKLNLFNEYKKGIMQKIFNQELRFKDANGNDYLEWEEFTLGQIGETYNGLTGKSADDFGNGKKYITYKNIFDNTKIDTSILEFVEVKENEKQNKVEYGDIFFTVSSETPDEVGYTSVLLDKINEDIYLNSFCFGYRLKSKEDFYPEFFRYVLRSFSFREKIYILAQGSTRFNLSKTEVLKIKLNLPCFEEQQKIADFLSIIDTKIEKISDELENLKEFKKGLLQQMFV